MVIPILKLSPGLWVDVRVTLPDLSVAVGGIQVTVKLVTLSLVATSIIYSSSPGQPVILGSVKQRQKRTSFNELNSLCAQCITSVCHTILIHLSFRLNSNRNLLEA